uniref:Uncharacterized protein n=1 Tax=Knipowitschia caucasica TaxID=637954 RepID=A0AAV2LT37_KNICA
MPKGSKSASAPLLTPRPGATSASPPPSGPSGPWPALGEPLAESDANTIKTDILSALREEIKTMFKSELHAALGENLTSIKSELLHFKAEISSNITTMKQEFAGLRGTIVDMEQSLSACTDDITILRSQVENMAKEIVKLENKCEDLESRSRRNNIRIIGVSE